MTRIAIHCTIIQNFKCSLDFFVSHFKFVLLSRDSMDIGLQTYNFLRVCFQINIHTESDVYWTVRNCDN